MSGDKYDEVIEAAVSIIKSFFGMLFGILLGTTIVLQGELIGIVFYAVAFFSAVVLCVLLVDLKKKDSERSNENAE